MKRLDRPGKGAMDRPPQPPQGALVEAGIGDDHRQGRVARLHRRWPPTGEMELELLAAGPSKVVRGVSMTRSLLSMDIAPLIPPAMASGAT